MFLFSIAILLFFIVIPACAEESSVIETGYTYVDGDTCDVFSFPATDKFSHLGLSKGEVAYSKNNDDPLIYKWNSKTGELKTFDTTELAEKKEDWISFWMEIKCLDISNGVVYYSLSTHKTTPTGTSASPDGLFCFDGVINENVIQRHFIDDLLVGNNLVLIKDSSDYTDEPQIDTMRLRIYSSDSRDVITIDNRTDISDPIGFGEKKVAVLAHGIGSHESDDRIPSDGIAVFDLVPALTGGKVEQITIPEAIDISSDEYVNVDQDCFSDRYFVWTKGRGITGEDSDRFHCNLYVTDLNTLQNTIIDSKDDLFFGHYAYAVDSDYLVYKNEDKIFLYHIPDGEKTEIRITGNNEFEVGDIVEFDEGQFLVRAYPKEFAGYEPSEYEIWFVDLNPFINPVEAGEIGAVETDNNEPGKTEAPLSPVVSVFSLLTAAALFTGSWGKR